MTATRTPDPGTASLPPNRDALRDAAQRSGAMPPEGRSSRRAALLLVVVLLAFGLRLATIGQQSLWLDEGDSLAFAQRGLMDLLRTFLRVGENGPLYFLFLHFWILLAGTSDLALRFPSTLAGTLTVPVAFVFGRRLGGRSLGIHFGIVVAASYYLVWYSREVRMYSAVVLLSLLASYLLVRGLQEPRRVLWVGYVGVTSLALYLHIFDALLIGAHAGIVLLYGAWARHLDRGVLVAMGALTLPYVPLGVWQLAVIAQAPGASVQWQFVPLGTIVQSLLATFTASVDPWVLLAMVGLMGVGLSALSLGRVGHATGRDVGRWPHQLNVLFLVAYAAIPVLAYYVISFRVPAFYARYFSLIAPAYYCWVAAGVAGLGRVFRPLGWLALIGLLVLWLPPAVAGGQQKDDWRAAAAFVAAVARPSDVFIFLPPSAEALFRHYYGHDFSVVSLPLRDPTAYVPDAVPGTLAEATRGRRGVWLVKSHVGWPTIRLVEDWLANNGRQMSQVYWTGQNPIGGWTSVTATYFLLRGRDASPNSDQPVASFDGGLDLLGWSGERQTVRAGEYLALTMRWGTQERLADEYRLSVRLVDDRDRVWGQVDPEPGGPSAPTQEWTPGEPVDSIVNLPVDPGTPVGPYTVRLVAYRVGSEPVEVAQPGRPGRPHALDLMPLRVTRPGVAPAAEWRPAGQPYDLDFGGRARLLSVDLPSQVEAGQGLRVVSYWKILKSIETSPRLRLWLDRGAAIVGEGAWPLAEGTGPWQAGEIVRSEEYVVVPPDADAGEATLHLALEGDAGAFSLRWAGLPLPWQPREAAVGNTAITTRPRQFSPPEMDHLSGARFGRGVALLGYRIDPAQPGRGDELRVTLFWQAAARLDRDYVVFVHLAPPGEPPLAQRDEAPAAGRAPTRSWLPGEVVRDEKQLLAPQNLPAGSYQLLVGLYDPSTERRLPVESGGDFVVLSTVEFAE